MALEQLKRKLRNSVESSNTSIKKNKLPSTIIGASYNNINHVDRSGSVPDPISKKLEHELTKIAPLGKKGYDNIVGCCCEVRASNKVLKSAPYINLDEILFTDAIRPRTGQIVKRCRNCKQVFG